MALLPSSVPSRRRPFALAVAALATLSLAAAACGDGGATTTASTASPPAGGPATVTVTLTDYRVDATPASVATGDVTFAIVNKGAETHEFLVVATDLDPTALPTDAAGDVAETGAGLTFIDEREGIEVGTAASLPLQLKAGHYVLLCNLPDHYRKGMVARFTVAADAAASSSSSPADPEDVVVPDAEVRAGLQATTSALTRLAADLGADPAAAMVQVYDGWYRYEGTVRSKDQSAYLDLEDQLARAKRAADQKDRAAMDQAADAFAARAAAYLAAHPG